MKNHLWILAALFIIHGHVLAVTDSLTIQENTLGVCTMDGVVESSPAGYTGTGFANINNGKSVGMSWSFNAATAGSYKVIWRYALGGADLTSRDGQLVMNNVAVDTVKFPHSGSSSWAVWIKTDTAIVEVIEGLNTIRLSSITNSGLPNIDFFQIVGSGFTPAQCVPSFTFSVQSNDAAGGTVSYSPEMAFYTQGTPITVEATPNPGYFFHSWSGVESSEDANFTFDIQQNTTLTALFYKNGSAAVPGANGYASVQHDNGTPYLLTGGSLGDTVEANTFEELKDYLDDVEPRVVLLSSHIVGTDEIRIASNKTLIGMNKSAHIEGIRVAINGVRNVIVRNMTFSKVLAADAIEINGSKNVWIDHCEFFSDREHDHLEDYYDGLLDIKNASSFITVSWCNMHHHRKAVLISSGDQEMQDSVTRITFHHNYFHNIASRLPLIRFGKAHVYNNYYSNNDGAISTRLGACVRVEKNYFANTDHAVEQSLDGNAQLLDNTFINSPYNASIQACELDVPYEYASMMDETADLPTVIPPRAGPLFASLTKTGTGSASQELSMGEPVTSFGYSWANATSAEVTGLPDGMSAVVNDNARTVTISGTPDETGEFVYTVSTVGAFPNATESGTIKVNVIASVNESVYGEDAWSVSPNPVKAGDAVTVSFSLTKSSPVTVAVYDLLGREVMKIIDSKFYTVGEHHVAGVAFSGRSGMYFYKLIAPGQVSTRKIVIK